MTAAGFALLSWSCGRSELDPARPDHAEPAPRHHAQPAIGGGGGTTDGVTRWGPFPMWVTTGDFNGDGRLDLVTASCDSYESSVEWTLNEHTVSVPPRGIGDGTFQAATSYGVGVGVGPWVVMTGDFNGDGALDLVGTSEGHDAVSVLLNRCSP